ncbi:hypothetical protein ACUY1T_02475 [Billgrantia sp. Q4P2]
MRPIPRCHEAAGEHAFSTDTEERSDEISPHARASGGQGEGRQRCPQW